MGRMPAGHAANDFQYLCRSRGGVASLLEAFAAVNRPSLGRSERDGRLLAASGAIGSGLYLGIVSRSSGSQSRGAFRLAGFATFRLVLELLVMEEQLFSRREYECIATFCTREFFVLKFHQN